VTAAPATFFFAYRRIGDETSADCFFIAFPLLLLAAADIALANDLFILATGRRDRASNAIDFNAALKRQKQQHVERHRQPVQGPPGSPRGTQSGIGEHRLSEDRRTAYVINHPAR